MKITISSEYTTIEADAKELRESNTLAGCFGNILRRAFQSTEPLEDEEEEEEEEIEEVKKEIEEK
mgnify:CR=1 FL=1